MIRNGILTITTFISVILFPWPLTVLLALITSLYEPLVPLAVGLFADTLFYVPQAGRFPICTLLGFLTSVMAVFVRRQLRASPVR